MPEETEQSAPAEPKPLFTEDELYNLRVIKINNGNDILACILGIDPEHMIVKRPCQVFRMIENNGSVTVVLSKWQPFSVGDNHIINRTSVVTYCKINDEMKEFYITSVKKQIEDENKPKKSIIGQDWPEWMDQPLNKSKIN